MCDTIVERNVEPPEFAYKVVQKYKEGVYVTPIVGVVLRMNKRKEAPRSRRYEAIYADELMPAPFGLRKDCIGGRVSDDHYGMWSVFRKHSTAEQVDLALNFFNLPPVILKVRCYGLCHKTVFSKVYPAFLVREIEPVEELPKNL